MSSSFTQFIIWMICALPALVSGDVQPFQNSKAVQDGAFGNYTRQSYLSDPNVIGPVANILVPLHPGVSPSKYIGWAPLGPHLPQSIPMLIDAKSFSTVWAGPALDDQTHNPTVHTCNNTRYLTWWAGRMGGYYGSGKYIMMNSRYEIVHNITAHAPLGGADMHEIFITPACTAIITGYKTIDAHLNFTRNVTTRLVESYFQEIDIATGRLVFDWQASKYIPDVIGETPYSLKSWEHNPKRWLDWFHINSIQKDHLGNYLISGRHTSTIYYLSGVNGNVLWRLGGRNSDFKLLHDGYNVTFGAQHHVRWLDRNLTRISLFDNHHGHVFNNQRVQSTGMIFKLDFARKEASLERTYNSTNHIISGRKGSVQVLNDGPVPENILMGYGSEPAWTEFAADGTVLADVSFGPLYGDRDNADNYRTLKVNWTGLPSWPPRIAPGPPPRHMFSQASETFSVVLKDENSNDLSNDTIYFSWNGATEIDSWVVLGSDNTTNLNIEDHMMGQVSRTGFEESFYVGQKKYVCAVAIDEAGVVLGATSVVQMANNDRSLGPAGQYGNATDSLTTAWHEYTQQQQQQQIHKHQLAIYAGVSVSCMMIIILCLLLRSQIMAGYRCLKLKLNPGSYFPLEANAWLLNDEDGRENIDAAPTNDKSVMEHVTETPYHDA